VKRAFLRAIGHFPRLKRALKWLVQLVRRDMVSSHYVELARGDAADEAMRLGGAWRDEEIPARQRDLVDRQLAEYRAGTPTPVFDVFIGSLRKLSDLPPDPAVLEIGCSSGYYGEVLQIANFPARYTGCDYSPSFVAMARKIYPAFQFDVEDATRLSYPDRSFDIVVSGCCLLHIPQYADAVAETARVARRYALFHRTPVVLGEPTKWYRKRAYGIETIEIHFNEGELLDLFGRNGLELVESYSLDESVSGGAGRATRSYVCRKISA
jgi:SAM-dependent methyltransferase